MKSESKEALIRSYKTILKEAVEARPSGIRLRIADIIGKNKSFVSQITNPNYKTPLPEKYIEPILEVLHLTTRERERFLESYNRAHPCSHKQEKTAEAEETRTLTIELPRLGSRQLERRVDQMIMQAAQNLNELAKRR